MKRVAIIAGMSLLAACTTAQGRAGEPAIKLSHGTQLRLWGVDVRQDGEAVAISGHVTRSALPRGPLNEHVDVGVESTTAQPDFIGVARLASPAALRDMGTSALNAQLPASRIPAGASILLSVGAGVAHIDGHE